MMHRTFIAATLLSLALPCLAAQPSQSNYPNRPVRVIVPVSPGGGVDAVARIVAQHDQLLWGQPFVVDNRTGAGGSIGVQLVAKAAPDGYTLLVSSSGVVTNAAVRPEGYDPVRDLTAITALNTAP
jgi:tripartite-type tricarboxylate transporter receptor subunit TctC